MGQNIKYSTPDCVTCMQTFSVPAGITQCTLNVHNLGTHVVQGVSLVGPLFTHSAFFFESIYGELQAMVTGPNKPVQQVSFSFLCAVLLFVDIVPSFTHKKQLVVSFEKIQTRMVTNHLYHRVLPIFLSTKFIPREQPLYSTVPVLQYTTLY